MKRLLDNRPPFFVLTTKNNYTDNRKITEVLAKAERGKLHLYKRLFTSVNCKYNGKIIRCPFKDLPKSYSHLSEQWGSLPPSSCGNY